LNLLPDVAPQAWGADSDEIAVRHSQDRTTMSRPAALQASAMNRGFVW
jgi:hypothetical protein